MMKSDTITHQREAAFHDAWAGSTPIDDVLVRECFEAPTAMENRFILSCMGDLKGKRLLDIGAGLGESSVYFALQGAQVTMTDISPGMVQTGQELAKKYGVEVQGIVSQAEDLGVPAETYDFVYIANTIHHVQP
jgi:2-polyprenyl-3-methyl-5-hydroxy-6-metoxy-1,4-benzoquinol methylase